MAIVSRKVSSEWMNDTVASPNRPNELKPITARNPSANHGTAIRRVTPPQDRLSASRRRRALATEIKSTAYRQQHGHQHHHADHLPTMIAASDISPFIAFPAPTT